MVRCKGNPGRFLRLVVSSGQVTTCKGSAALFRGPGCCWPFHKDIWLAPGESWATHSGLSLQNSPYAPPTSHLLCRH